MIKRRPAYIFMRHTYFESSVSNGVWTKIWDGLGFFVKEKTWSNTGRCLYSEIKNINETY